MSTNAVPLQPSSANGWRSGFASLLRKENRAAWGGRRWLVQSVIWLGLFNGLLAFMLFLAPTMRSGPAVPPGMENPTALGLSLFFTLLVQFGAVGAVILAHDKIVGEKLAGTLAWVLSKPVSRQAVVISKLASGAIRTLLFIVAVPGLVAYIEISIVADKPIAAVSFLLALGTAWVSLAFYLTLALMLSAVFDQRSVILASAFGVMFSLPIVASFSPVIADVSPVYLAQVASTLAEGQALPAHAVLAIIFTALWSIVFVSVTLWRFEREEF